MAENIRRTAERAADSTTAFNPVVGLQRSDILASFRSFLIRAAGEPSTLTSHLKSYSKDVVQILLGKSDRHLAMDDPRFSGDVWQDSRYFRTLLQIWLASKDGLNSWVESADLDEVDEARAQFLIELLMDAAAPTNMIFGNPKALERAIETRGGSLLKGAQNAWDDIRFGNGLPSQVDKSAFKLGVNLAATPGSVVFRNRILELIQYEPQTEDVYRRPLMFVPPQINKYYVQDLSPGKSQIEWMAQQGYQVFAISWRNPDESCSHLGLIDYVEALIEASDVVMSITGQKAINFSGACSGGITLASFLSHLNAIGDKRVGAVSLMVSVLDPMQEDSDTGLFIDDITIEKSRRKSAKQGLLRGDDLAWTFSWMRPRDLIWNYVVNNYLMGDEPPAFDVLAWNADTANLPATLHSDYLDFYIYRPFKEKNALYLGEHALDISETKNDIFCVAGTTDHITPWKACYRSTGLSAGEATFVLSRSGHVQALVNPPQTSKSSYKIGIADQEDADQWLAGAQDIPGSWWPAWDAWLSQRSGVKKQAPKKVGSKRWPAIGPAPGRYVRDH